MNARQTLNSLQRGMALLLVVAAAASLYYGLSAAWSDSRMLAARWQLTQWQQGKAPVPKAGEWGAVRNDLVNALQWAPGDPQIYENLGHLYGLRAASSRAIPELEDAMLAQTIVYYREALARRPMSSYAWANLALALHYQKADRDGLWVAYDRAFKYGQKEGGIQRILAEIGFARWSEAGTQRQAELTSLVANAQDHSRADLIRIAARYGKKDFAPR